MSATCNYELSCCGSQKIRINRTLELTSSFNWMLFSSSDNVERRTIKMKKTANSLRLTWCRLVQAHTHWFLMSYLEIGIRIHSLLIILSFSLIHFCSIERWRAMILNQNKNAISIGIFIIGITLAFWIQRKHKHNNNKLFIQWLKMVYELLLNNEKNNNFSRRLHSFTSTIVLHEKLNPIPW